MSEYDALRDDHAQLVLMERHADILAERMARRFHALNHKAKGGAVDPMTGQMGTNPKTQNQWGGKGVIKFNPSSDEIQQGIKQQVSLFTWESPDGLPHYVTIEVGRLSGGVGGPDSAGAITLVGAFPRSSTIGGTSGGTFPAPSDQAGNPLYYRGNAQVLIGTPGTMQDPFYIDINRGQRFTALASYVAVTAQMNGPPVNSVSGNVIKPDGVNAFVSGSLAVYATLGVGVAPSLAPVLYTQYIDNDLSGPGAAAVFRVIPPRANVLLPVLSNFVSVLMQISFFDVNGNGVGTTQPFLTGALTTPLEIPGDAFSVELSITGNTSANYRLIYQLSV